MDRPAVEFHPYGTITLNFDDGPVKLRRCRLGDLEYAKNLLAEIRVESTATVEQWTKDRAEIQAEFPQASDEEGLAKKFLELTPEERAANQARVTRLNELNENLEASNRELVYRWLTAVAERMGDGPIPPKEDWPIEILDNPISDVIDHWQNRPLASGRTSPNGTTAAANSSTLPVPIQSSPQEPLPL